MKIAQVTKYFYPNLFFGKEKVDQKKGNFPPGNSIVDPHNFSLGVKNLPFSKKKGL